MSPETGKVNGAPRRLTAGAGNELEPACVSGDAFTFTNAENVGDVWSIPFDLDGGKPLGALERMIQGHARRESPSLSVDGRYVAFSSNQSGQKNIWLREVATGKESQSARSPLVQRYPVINASGSRIAYRAYENGKRVVYVSPPGGVPEMVCEGCARPQDTLARDVHFPDNRACQAGYSLYASRTIAWAMVPQVNAAAVAGAWRRLSR